MSTPVAPKVLEIPYGGTISTDIVPGVEIKTPITEFYRLPLKQRNEITVLVQASMEAHILLYDGDTGPSVSPIKVEIVIGGDKNSTLSIGLLKDDGTGKYPKEIVQKSRLLCATHWKAFNIRWYNGRVMVYNHGYARPLITWDGPAECAFSRIGVRTVGCSGDWRVQGLPKFTTADGAEYKDIEINCGRLDFEVSAYRDAYIMFTPQPKADPVPSMHALFGCGDVWNTTKRTSIWSNFVQVAYFDETTVPISMNEYRRFWVKWDANNVMIGHGDCSDPYVIWLKGGTPVKPIRYFGLQAYLLNDYCYWHILDLVRDEDTAPRKPGEQNYTGAERGYVSFDYTSYT